MAQFSKIEIFINFFIYLCFLCYGVYQIFLVSKEIALYRSFLLPTGWQIFGQRSHDNTDNEWKMWKTFLCTNIKWFFIHIISSEMCRLYKSEYIPYIHAGIGGSFILFNFNIFILKIMLIIGIGIQIVANWKRKFLVWTYAFIWLLIINAFRGNLAYLLCSYLHLDPRSSPELVIILSWNLLRLLSFALDSIDNNNADDRFSLSNQLGYVWYFPNLYFGPFMLYSRYETMLDCSVILNRNYLIDFYGRLKTFTVAAIRCTFWYFFMEFSWHFLYVNCIQQNIEIVQELNPWALYALGFLMGQYFHVKYVVFYGLGNAFAQMDRIYHTPSLPKCIARIHWYSDMWKYFDKGLYEFLHLYIYTPLCEKNTKTTKTFPKIYSNFLTFSFIYTWHGMYPFVLVWSTLNFICLQFERFGKQLVRQHQSTINFWCPKPRTQRRLAGLLATQIFIPSALANFYFFAGIDVGNWFMLQTYWHSNIYVYALLTLCSYGIYQTSEEIRQREFRIKQQKVHAS